jgi:hypothetical protein
VRFLIVECAVNVPPVAVSAFILKVTVISISQSVTFENLDARKLSFLGDRTILIDNDSALDCTITSLSLI